MYTSILQTIGQTPLVRINRMNPNPGVNMYAKLEGFNPTGSIKDRIALRMIQQAESDGCLKEGQIILEATSGNTGIGLAMIGAVKGYPVTIVMSETVSVERRKIIQAFGANIILTAAGEGTDGAIRRVRQMVENEPDRYFNPDQFSNNYNKLAHYKVTAEEIWQQTGGMLTHFVSSIGTSGTIMGVGTALKENKPSIQIICAHPTKGHYIQGLKNMEEAIVPQIYQPERIDRQVMVDSEKAFEITRRIVREEGIFVGMSSGAAMAAALEVVNDIERGCMVIIFPDRGEKYLSTKLFNNE
ncbi:MAG: cysteine synthase [FCB group bacterium]|nr:cysteine synthase [FCB group bacterium]